VGAGDAPARRRATTEDRQDEDRIIYAIVESGGKQYKVEKGETLLVDRLPAKEGEKVGLRAVMFRDGEVVTDPGELEKVKVEATVSEHLRGPKIRVFKYKPKKGYRRRAGHRSELTRVEITELRKLSRKPAARKAEPEAEPKSEAKAEPKAEPARKTGAARKGGTARKTAARKPAARKTAARKSSTRKTSGSTSTRKGSSGGS
jgi:large subunit ribosomal protein L21